VAARLRQEAGLDVSLIDGDRGEFSVMVDGKEAISKTGAALPTEDEVLEAVHRIVPANT
jgi:hypothetical protein